MKAKYKHIQRTYLQVKEILERTGVRFTEIDSLGVASLARAWGQAFGQTSKSTDQGLLKSHLWHVFTWGERECVKGREAIEQYQSQYSADFFVFGDELRGEQYGFRCEGAYPDFSVISEDAYVAHITLNGRSPLLMRRILARTSRKS